MAIGPQFQQQSLFTAKEMGAIERSGRRGLIKNHYGYAVGGGFLGDDHELDQTNRFDPSYLRRTRPTEEVEGALAGTTIPTQDLKLGTSKLRSNSKYNYFGNALGRDALGGFNSMNGVIDYNRDDNMGAKRAIITHEVGHAVAGASMGMLDNARERDKHIRYLSSLRVDSAFGKVVKAYGNVPGRVDPQLEAHPIRSKAGEAISEGSAEGYRLAHSPTPRGFETGYTGEIFGPEGSDHNRLFNSVRETVRQTGQVIPNTDIMAATRLAGVLDSDLDENGKRDFYKDDATTARMAMVTLGGEMRHLPEYRLRQKAISGEVVQGSMFPDMVPETDQFGGTPAGKIARSPRGEALFRGQPTELAADKTMTAEKSRQDAVKRAKWREEADASLERWNARPDLPKLPTSSTPVQEKPVATAPPVSRPSTTAAGNAQELPKHVGDWLGKLVYERKKNYAEAYARYRHFGGDEPAVPKGLKPEHADAARKKIDRLLG